MSSYTYIYFLAQDDVIFFWHHRQDYGDDIHFGRET